MSDFQGPPLADPRGQIAGDILQVHQDSYGTGAGEVAVHILDDVVIVILDELELSPAEITLLEGGSREAVVTMREEFQSTIGATFGAIVERATGRRVTSFLSNTSLPARYSIEIFRLEGAEVPRVEPDEQLDVF